METSGTNSLETVAAFTYNQVYIENCKFNSTVNNNKTLFKVLELLHQIILRS